MPKKQQTKKTTSNNPAGKNIGGRPSKYNTINIETVKLLASKGFTNEEMSKVLNIACSTFDKYLAEEEAFSGAVKEGRAMADALIERSLYEAARGYEHAEDKIFCNKDGEVTTVRTVKHYAPDTVAAMFWLCNRQKERWQHIQKIEHSGGNKPIQFMNLADLSTEQLQKIAEMAIPENGK